MSGVVSLVVIATLLTTAAMIVTVVIFQARRQERRELRVIADRLRSEAQLEALTLKTLQHMRSAARAATRALLANLME